MADTNQSNTTSSQSSSSGGPATNSGFSGMPKLGDLFSNMNFENKKFWMIFGGIVALILIAIIVLTFVSGKKEKVATQPSPAVAQKVQNQSPVALPAIAQTDQNSARTNELKAYFKAVSLDFKDEFMANIPEITLDAYKKYKDAPAGDAKLEAARAFFIYLNNPGKYKDDPAYKQFLKDVRADLEKTLGRALFAGQ